MELVDALDQTFKHTHGVIANVRADQLDNPTPCSEWKVRDLMSHAIGVVAGIGAAAAGSQSSEFKLGDDPAAQFQEAATANIAAWRAPGAMDKVVNGGPGPMPGHVLAGINLLDTATHTWDLAKATGQDAQLPADVAATALEMSRQIISPEIRSGRFAPEVPAPSGCGPTDQLVAFLGRQP
jgi:uncharacterized protein (TIGR03086 family)